MKSKQNMVPILAVVHPAETSGLHAFWGARWKTLQDKGIDLHLLVPEELDASKVRGVPRNRVHVARFGRPRGAKHIIANFRYFMGLGSDSRTISDCANRVGAKVIVSHGPHFISGALSARRNKDLRHILLVHGDSAPAFSAKVLRIIRQPDYTGFELASSSRKYQPARGRSGDFDIKPALQPTFLEAELCDKNLSRDALGITDNGSVVIGMVASISPGKRVDKFFALADAVAGMHERAFAFRLIGVVANSQRGWYLDAILPRISALRTRGMDVEVVDGAEGVVDLMRGLDVLTITSDAEGIPNVGMEALACGVPVVSLDLEGLHKLKRILGSVEFDCAVSIVPRSESEIETMALAVVNASERKMNGIEERVRSVFSAEVATVPLVSAFLTAHDRARRTS